MIECRCNCLLSIPLTCPDDLGVTAYKPPLMYNAAQVYASYKYRRDLAEAAKVTGIMGRSRQLKRSEAEHLLVRPFIWSLFLSLEYFFVNQRLEE